MPARIADAVVGNAVFNRAHLFVAEYNGEFFIVFHSIYMMKENPYITAYSIAVQNAVSENHFRAVRKNQC